RLSDAITTRAGRSLSCRMPRAVEVLISVGRIRNVPINTGVTKVESRNERVLTRSRYSRFAMIQTFLIEKSVIFAGDSFDEDLFERRVHDLEAEHAQLAHRALQQFLRVGAGLEAQFGVIAVVIQRIDERIAGQASAVALIVDLHEAAAVAVFDFAETPLQHRLAAIDQADRI